MHSKVNSKNRSFSSGTCILLISISILLGTCADPNLVTDQNVAITHHAWDYKQIVKLKVPIDHATLPYNIYLYLRHTEDYKYANLFVRIEQVNPNKTTIIKRYEFTLANVEGQWLGKCFGSVYAHRFLLSKKIKFPQPGTYTFEIEQNMRENPLKGISDIGLCVKKAD